MGAMAVFADVEIVAHRGSSDDAPENTLAAMKLAWERGADAIETDLWLSKDGKIVVMHDATTKRTGGGVDKKIAEQTWEELQQLDVGAWKAGKFKGERIPSLEGLLGTVPPRGRAYLEIKCGPEIVPALGEALAKAGLKAEQIVIISFNHAALAASKKALPAYEHLWIHGYSKDKKSGEFPTIEPVLAKAREGHFDGLDLQFDWPITADFVKLVKSHGLKLATWTVDDVAVAKRLIEAGVDGITTNKPGVMAAELKAKR